MLSARPRLPGRRARIVLAVVLLLLVMVASLARTTRPPGDGGARAGSDGVARIWAQGGVAAVAIVLMLAWPELAPRLRGAPGWPRRPRPPPRTPRPGRDVLATAGDRLRQPLQAMSLYAGSLSRDASPTQQVALRGLEDSVRELARVLDDIEQTVGLLHDDVPVRPLPLAAGEVLSALAVPAEHAVGLHRHDGALWIDSDPRLAGRLLQLLVDDASRRARRRVLVAARRAGDRVRVQVRDDGPPLPPCAAGDVLPMLVRRAGEAEAHDDGLGLAVGARIVELLALDVVLRPGAVHGNTLSVEFPRASAPRVAATPDDATVLSLALLAADARDGRRTRSRLPPAPADGGDRAATAQAAPARAASYATRDGA